MNPYLIAITKDIHAYQIKAQSSYRRAVFCSENGRFHDRAIHIEAARFCIELARKLRLQRERTTAVAIKMRRAA